MNGSKLEKVPVLFLGHGSPMNAIQKNEFTESLSKLGAELPRPKAILMVSAHWETQGSHVTGMDKPRTIHDFYGFPKELFNVQYPAPGRPTLADQISSTIIDPQVAIDRGGWGLDHGAWSILRHIYPKADIPVIQLSLDRSKSMRDHYELGKSLRFLRDQGVMIIGSGNIVHNLGEIDWNINANPHDWALEFDEWAKSKLLARDFDPLVTEARNSQAGKLSIPTLEHYLPFVYALGAADSSDTMKFTFEGFQNASMSMRCLAFS
ncbi:MAG: 4,5-DOPA dioxygenase extradiol [Bdellovibrionaceae bacterium]|nr:4,5-DOPA dioxygenase extradiol [Pseudobdellovibrionaceae bacterium]